VGEPIPAAEAVGVLAAACAGRPGAELGTPLGRPVLTVDLDGIDAREPDRRRTDSQGPAAGVDLTPPVGWPCVVIAVSTAALLPSAPKGADVLLTSVANPPAPWVGMADVPLAAAALVDRIEAHGHASAVLVQVLRAGAQLDIDAALLLESLAYTTLQAGPDHLAWLASRPGRSMDFRTDPAVTVTRRGDTLAVTLNRPERRNAYSARMRDDLFAALQVATADPSVTQIVIDGAGPNFCSGGDLAEFGQKADPATAHGVRMARSSAALLARLAPRVQVDLRGASVGAGIELSAFAGRVTATGDSTCWLPEIAMGLIPGAGGTVSLPRRIGAARTAWLALSGAHLDAPTATRWGLIDGPPG
jgi:hypothetical protein